MMKRLIAVMIVCCLPVALLAQDKKLVRQGNKLYEQKKYKEATEAYQQALTKNPNNIPGLFNLGNSLYQQKSYDNARKVLEATSKTAPAKATKGDANYNIGNTYMEEKKWEEAINAYKQALRNNPQDADAKYNLSYAQQMLKKEGGGGGKDKDKNKDQNQDQQNKDQQNKDDKNKDKQDEQNKNNKDQQDQQNEQDKEGEKDKDKQSERPQPQPSKLSKEQADQLLNALQQEEKKLQDKLQKGKGVPVKVEKDW